MAYSRFTEPVFFHFAAWFTDRVFAFGSFQNLPGLVNRELTTRFFFELTASLPTGFLPSVSFRIYLARLTVS